MAIFAAIRRAIRNVTSGLTLLAFVAVAILFAYRRYLKSRERLFKDRGLNDPKVVQAISGFIGVDQDKLTREAAREIALKQIENKYRTNRLMLIAFIALLIIVAGVAVASMFSQPAVSGPVRLQGALGSAVAGINSSPEDFTVALNGQSLDKFWFGEVAADDERAAVQKICDTNPCLVCDPARINEARHVTIRLGTSPLVSFTDKFGETWQRCGSA